MPPKVKFQKEDIVNAALNITRTGGIAAVTAREVAAELGVSTRPIFTWFETIDQLKGEVYLIAKDIYRSCIERGLTEPLPFLGIWQQYFHFAKAEPELYRLLFLTPPCNLSGGAMEAFEFSRDLARESIMSFYNMDAKTADCFFRDIWLVAFSFATLAVTDNCPYSENEIFAIGGEISLSVCKAYKEIPGLPEGKYDRDMIFSQLVRNKPAA